MPKAKQLLKVAFNAVPPRLRKTLVLPLRLNLALSYYRRPLTNVFRWLVHSRENTNVTYELTPLNKEYLAAFLSVVTGVRLAEVSKYIAELENDEELKDHVKKLTCQNPQYNWNADEQARYGRRLGWYALVRCTKPTVVVETGVDKGLGSCVLAAAVRRNVEEGFRGFVYALDIDPDAGYLFRPSYSNYGEILNGDSVAILKGFQLPIDILIHDSFHSEEHESAEFRAVENKLSAGAIVLSDNAHVTTALYQFAKRTGRDFLFFQEVPENHWYPGGGIGAAFTRAGG